MRFDNHKIHECCIIQYQTLEEIKETFSFSSPQICHFQNIQTLKFNYAEAWTLPPKQFWKKGKEKREREKTHEVIFSVINYMNLFQFSFRVPFIMGRIKGVRNDSRCQNISDLTRTDHMGNNYNYKDFSQYLFFLSVRLTFLPDTASKMIKEKKNLARRERKRDRWKRRDWNGNHKGHHQ